jgi:LmbE family N-acetylglucosaminyl deacetylase
MIIGIIIVGLVIAIAVCVLRVREYRRWFRLPTRRTDSLHCRLAAVVVPLSLDPDGFEAPVGVPLLGRTVLLELRVGTSLLGRLFDPFIETRGGGLTHRQYFERGASGRRLLDLSPHFQSAEGVIGSRMHLRGKSMRWQREASLRVFEPPALADTNVLIVAPHPDDAEIAAFGVYATHRSWIVTITAGERGGGVPAVGMPAEEYWQWTALLRVADSLSAPQLGKVRPERCVNLAYPGAMLERMQLQPSQSFQLACEPKLPRSELRAMNVVQDFRSGTQCTWNNLIEELRLVLELAKPDIIVCPHPLLDAHSDHVFTTYAVEQAMRNSVGPRPLFLLYAVHHAGARAYPAGWRRTPARVGWPIPFTRIRLERSCGWRNSSPSRACMQCAAIDCRQPCGSAACWPDLAPTPRVSCDGLPDRPKCTMCWRARGCPNYCTGTVRGPLRTELARVPWYLSLEMLERRCAVTVGSRWSNCPIFSSSARRRREPPRYTRTWTNIRRCTCHRSRNRATLRPSCVPRTSARSCARASLARCVPCTDICKATRGRSALAAWYRIGRTT